MTLRENESIPGRHARFLRVDFHYPEIEGHKNIHCRERSANMAGPASRNSTDRKPSSPASQHLQLCVVWFTTHIYFLLIPVRVSFTHRCYANSQLLLASVSFLPIR